MKVRVGIIGCGSIAKFRHAPEYEANPDAEIVGFYDLNKERAMYLANIYGGKVYDSYEELLADENIDAISDCSTNEMHHIVSSNALKQGKHVLCEKPMAISVEKATEIMDSHNDMDKVLMIGHNQRLTKAHNMVRDMLLSNELGRVLTFNTSFGHKGPEYWGSDKGKNTWFFNKSRSVIGVAGDLGIHKFDLIRYLLDDEVVEVSAFEGSLHKTYTDGSPIDVSDNMICIMRTAKGSLGTARFSWTYYGDEDNSTIINCEKGEVRIYADKDYQIIVNKMGEEIINYKVESIQSNENQTSTGIIDEFIRSIKEDKKPCVTGKDGVMALKIVEAAIESAKTSRSVKIDIL